MTDEYLLTDESCADSTGASNDESPQERPEDIPFDEYQLLLEEVVERLQPAQVRNACRSAFVHLRKAWKLHPIDAEMSLFRAITAEEEAATAVIHALRHQQYPGAQQLQPRQHHHKTAVWAFLEAVQHIFAVADMPSPKIALAKRGDPKIEIHFVLDNIDGVEPFRATLDEPFDMVMKAGKKGKMKVHSFDEEMANLATKRGARDIRAYIATEANLRNRALYASADGIPAAVFPDSLILNRAGRVTALCIIAIGLMQTPTHQPFATQCLQALLAVLPKLEPVDVRYPDEGSGNQPVVTITREAGSSPKLGIAVISHIQIIWSIQYQTWPRRWPSSLDTW